MLSHLIDDVGIGLFSYFGLDSMIWTSENLSLSSDFSVQKMQGAKACFSDTDKNEYGTSLQRASTRRPSNQTHEGKIIVFERYTSEDARVNSNNVLYII
jgi:hypothetical protein